MNSWTKLIDPKKPEARENFTYQQLGQASSNIVCKLNQLVEHELNSVLLEALIHADMFWELSRDAREIGDDSEITYVGTRVRLRSNSLIAEWYRINKSWAKDAPPNQIYSNYIRKGRGGYDLRKFSQEPIWAQNTIRDVETRYSLCRSRSAALSKIRRAIKEYEVLIERAFGDYAEP